MASATPSLRQSLRAVLPLLLCVLMGVSEPALSTKEGQFAVGELLAVDDVNAPADCAYVAKFTVSKDTDDPIPIVFMHHVCMRAGRGLVREATDALQELGIDAGSKSAQEVLLRQLVSKFVAFTEDEINRTDFTGARQFTELHSRHEAHSWPSSLFSVAVDGLSLELRLFNKEPVNQRITFFCKTLLLPEASCVQALWSRVSQEEGFTATAADASVGVPPTKESLLVGDLEQPTRKPTQNNAPIAQDPPPAVAPELRLGIEELVKTALDQRRTDQHDLEQNSGQVGDRSKTLIAGATSVFAVVGESRTTLTTATEGADGSTLFTLFFERHHMRPQPGSWPPDALQWGFGLQGYIGKANANRMDALLLSRGTEQTLSRCDAVVMTRVSAASQQDVSNDHAHEVTGHWQMERPVHCGRDEAVQIELHLAPVDGRAPQVSATSVVTPVRGLVALLPPSTKLPAGVNLNEQLRLSGHGQTEATEVHFEVPESRFPGSAYTALQHAVTVAFHEAVEDLARKRGSIPPEELPVRSAGLKDALERFQTRLLHLKQSFTEAEVRSARWTLDLAIAPSSNVHVEVRAVLPDAMPPTGQIHGNPGSRPAVGARDSNGLAGASSGSSTGKVPSEADGRTAVNVVHQNGQRLSDAGELGLSVWLLDVLGVEHKGELIRTYVSYLKSFAQLRAAVTALSIAIVLWPWADDESASVADSTQPTAAIALGAASGWLCMVDASVMMLPLSSIVFVFLGGTWPITDAVARLRVQFGSRKSRSSWHGLSTVVLIVMVALGLSALAEGGYPSWRTLAVSLLLAPVVVYCGGWYTAVTQAEVDAVIQRAVEFRHFYFRPDGPAPVAVAASLCFISVCVIRTLLGTHGLAWRFASVVWSLGLQLAIVALPFLSPPQWLLNLTLDVLRPLWRAITAVSSAMSSCGPDQNTSVVGQANSKRARSIRKRNRKKKSSQAPSGGSGQGQDSQKDELVQDTALAQKQIDDGAGDDGDSEWTTVSGAPAPAPSRQKNRPRKKVQEAKPDPFAYFNVTTAKPRPASKKDAAAASAEASVHRSALSNENDPRFSSGVPVSADDFPKDHVCATCTDRGEQTAKHKEELDDLESQLAILRNKLQAQRQRHRRELETEIAKAQQRAARQLELQRELLSDVQRQFDELQDVHSALLDEAAFQQKVAIDRENELHEALRRERAEREADKDRHRAQQQTSRMATPPRPTRPVSDDKDRGAPGLLTPGAVRSLSGGKGNQRGHVERAGSDRARTRRTPFASPSPSFASRLDQTELSADENPKAPNGESLTPEAATFSRLYKRHLARYGALTSSDAVDVAVQVYLTGVAEQYHTSASQGRGAKSSNRRSLAAVCADVRAFLPPEVAANAPDRSVSAFIVQLGASVAQLQQTEYAQRQQNRANQVRDDAHSSLASLLDHSRLPRDAAQNGDNAVVSFEYQAEFEQLRKVFPELGGRTCRRILRACNGDVQAAAETLLDIIDDMDGAVGSGGLELLPNKLDGGMIDEDDMEGEEGEFDAETQERITRMVLERYHMQEHRDAHNPHISQVVPKDNKSKVRYYDNKVVSHDGKRYMTLPAKSGHDATREDRMATSVSLAWVKRKRRGGQAKREPPGGFKKGPISSKHDMAKSRASRK